MKCFFTRFFGLDGAFIFNARFLSFVLSNHPDHSKECKSGLRARISVNFGQLVLIDHVYNTVSQISVKGAKTGEIWPNVNKDRNLFMNYRSCHFQG